MRQLLAAVVVAASLLCLPRPALAQDTDPSTTTTLPAMVPQEIIPRPNSGTPPEEAGDRGGALQLGLLAMVVVAIGGGVLLVVRQSRQARRGDGTP